jgi:ABC-2 type transport system ATP-binding protein
MIPLIEAQNLVKRFKQVDAVNGIDLAIPAGVCFGLLGPNGAGKTTTIEMMEGLLEPTSGTVRFRGAPLGAEFRQKTGMQFQATALPEHLRVKDTLKLFSRLYDRPAPLAKVIELCALGELLDRDTRKLSGGQRQRLLLALALVNDPDLIFLDEPTTGLDPQARRNFWSLVKGVKARGKTVILTTHYMDEAYELCDDIAIVDRGRVIARGSPDALLRAQFEGAWIELPVADLPPGFDAAAFASQARRALTRDGVFQVQTREVNDTLARLLAAGARLAHLKVRSPTLEDLFLELTGKELRA